MNRHAAPVAPHLRLPFKGSARNAAPKQEHAGDRTGLHRAADAAAVAGSAGLRLFGGFAVENDVEDHGGDGNARGTAGQAVRHSCPPVISI